MSEELTIKRGTKIDEADAASIDKSKLGILLAKPPQDATEGQARYNGYTQCPWCGHVGWTVGLDTNYYVNVVCGSCGGLFRA
ncbi:hypothetical protein L2U69_18865 [Zavarzinia compransoris]|uniref:hypothetical protein n=1 Tax=Zavarzinia marina TaxID=2911065 RepID=UPI001F2ABE29|nr:hypothetical protein [Zavarzinia marina]MCF4165733.1 hypothetical protein [Zavarzinia marina]MCF4167715.1 hypothetical protein [Zavarzinia marina]